MVTATEDGVRIASQQLIPVTSSKKQFTVDGVTGKAGPLVQSRVVEGHRLEGGLVITQLLVMGVKAVQDRQHLHGAATHIVVQFTVDGVTGKAGPLVQSRVVE